MRQDQERQRKRKQESNASVANRDSNVTREGGFQDQKLTSYLETLRVTDLSCVNERQPEVCPVYLKIAFRGI